MVNKVKSFVKTARGVPTVARASVQPAPIQQAKARAQARVHARLADPAPRGIHAAAIDEEAADVIDLGAPHPLRRASTPVASRRPTCSALPPNPRLYPGPRPEPKQRPRRAESGRGRRGNRTFRRTVPNSRLYRPGPPRPAPPPPPPACPRTAWPPPAPPRALDTASRVALRLGSAWPASPSPPPPAFPPSRLVRTGSPSEATRHLVVTLPAAVARYRPTSEYFRARASAAAAGSGSGTGAGSGESTPPAARVPYQRRAMEAPRAPAPAPAAGRQSASPEDRSEGNETLSAPSEFLAEFLSAIMRRQYAEALKYCRLILQYEPHNATARGFYPLLRHRVARALRTEEAAAAMDAADDSSGDEATHASIGQRSAEDSPFRHEQEASHEGSHEGSGSHSHSSLMEQSAQSEGESEASAAGDHSELELDSSDALHSSPSLSLSRRTERTDSASAGCWESTGSASASRSEGEAGADDNGNAAPALPTTPVLPTTPRLHLLPDDLENDNAVVGAGEPHHSTHLKSESVSSLRRLRAQFACSIK